MNNKLHKQNYTESQDKETEFQHDDFIFTKVAFTKYLNIEKIKSQSEN